MCDKVDRYLDSVEFFYNFDWIKNSPILQITIFITMPLLLTSVARSGTAAPLGPRFRWWLTVFHIITGWSSTFLTNAKNDLRTLTREHRLTRVWYTLFFHRKIIVTCWYATEASRMTFIELNGAFWSNKKLSRVKIKKTVLRKPTYGVMPNRGCPQTGQISILFQFSTSDFHFEAGSFSGNWAFYAFQIDRFWAKLSLRHFLTLNPWAPRGKFRLFDSSLTLKIVWERFLYDQKAPFNSINIVSKGSVVYTHVSIYL